MALPRRTDAGPPLPHPGPILAVALSPDGRVAFTGGWLQGRLWELPGGRSLAGWGLPSEIWSAAFSPDGRTLLIGYHDGSARLWEVPAGRVKGPPLTHSPGGVHAVAFSPDGRLLATGGADRTARLWDAVTGRPVGPPLPHHATVRGTAFRRDGRRLATVADDGTARLWPVPVPAEGDGEAVRQWVEAVTGLEWGGPGGVRELAPDVLRRRRGLPE